MTACTGDFTVAGISLKVSILFEELSKWQEIVDPVRSSVAAMTARSKEATGS